MPRAVLRPFRRALRFARYYARVPDRYWTRQLMAARVRPGTVRLLRPRHALVVEGFPLPLLPRHSFVLSALDSVRALTAAVGSEFEIDADGMLRCRIDTHEYFVTTEEELRILVEIHVLGTYNFLVDGPCVVCDIGMNVGFASLYFASRADTLVYGFEPFRQTYEAAVRNLALNPALAARIKSRNVGLAGENRRAVFPYSQKWKGLAGLHSARRVHEERRDVFLPEEVELCNVADVLGEVLQNHAGQSIVLKIDCEGAEYEIVESLAQMGYLKQIAILLIEWHQLGPDALAANLRSAGFAVLSFSPHDRQSGMLYAIRRVAT